LRVLEGVEFRGSVELSNFELSVEFSDFEVFFTLFLGLSLLLSFAGFCGFPLLDDFLELFLVFLVF
jgi:hypothetical protein